MPILATACFILFFIFNTQAQQQWKKKKTYDKQRMYKYTIDSTMEQTEARAKEQYKECPPLRPYRFRRRVKMLFGIDIYDYPEDAKIWFAKNYQLSLKYQIVEGGYMYGQDEPVSCNLPSNEIYINFRKYLYMNDKDGFMRLEKYRNHLEYECLYSRDILLNIYECSITTPLCLIRYIDNYSFVQPDIYYFNICIIPLLDRENRISDIKKDLIYIYIINFLKEENYRTGISSQCHLVKEKFKKIHYAHL